MLTVEFKDKLDLLLIKYEDEIMKVMFEESKDEYGERYAEVYKIEWYYYKQNIVIYHKYNKILIPATKYCLVQGVLLHYNIINSLYEQRQDRK